MPMLQLSHIYIRIKFGSYIITNECSHKNVMAVWGYILYMHASHFLDIINSHAHAMMLEHNFPSILNFVQH